MTNNGRSAGLHAPSGPAEQEALIPGDVGSFGSVSCKALKNYMEPKNEGLEDCPFQVFLLVPC